MLRYLERHYGIDPDQIKQEMVSEIDAKNIKILGSCKYPLENGYLAVVKDRMVLTIY